VKITSKRSALVGAFAAALALTVSACGGGTSTPAAPAGEVEVIEEVVPGEGEAPAKPETLTVSFWMGIDPQTIAEFEEETGISVEVWNSADTSAALEQIRNGLAAGGAGLADVHYLDDTMFFNLMEVPEDWATLPPIPGRWVDWKEGQATVNGELKGYGTDIGPLAIAFDSKLLAEHGFPSTPEAFGEWIGGENATWETFLAAGREFHDATGIAWINSLGDVYTTAVGQLPGAFEDPATGRALNLADNQPVHEIFNMVTQGIEDGLSAGISIWSPDASPGFQNQAFATVIAPAWMTGHISQTAAGLDGWLISNTVPGGGGNWGGSFISVPATSPNVYWATRLADWLTTPEAAVRQFIDQGHFPSQVEALNDPRLTDTPSEFFGGQHLGEIYSQAAENMDVASATGFRGTYFPGLSTLVGDGINRVQDGIETPAQAWDSVLSNFNALGLTTN